MHSFPFLLLLTLLLINSDTVMASESDHDRMFAIFEAFNHSFIYPNNIEEAKSINSTLFADNIQGRVDATGSFEGRELNTEYVFGLFASISKNDTFNLLPVPVASELRGFLSSGNMAAFSLLLTVKHAASGIEFPVIMDTWIRVDEDGKIDQYEATFKRLDWLFDVFFKELIPFLAESLDIPVESINATFAETVVKTRIAESICKIHEENCLGEDQQYDSYDDCIDFLMSIPIGKGYSLGQNTAMCRMIHQEMVPMRPEHHCSHIGPSGGGMCIDREFAKVSEDVFFRNMFIEEGSC